ncbi:MAG: hypothetical protein HY321_18885 [Armatimonadetes bacterium]|nr:hypothetical protein [Armatimonadota bacterium]
METQATGKRSLRFGVGFIVAALLALLPSAARAQSGLANFALPGAYFPTASATRAALGDVKFYHEGTLFQKSLGLVAVRATAGLDLITASSGYFPFTGGSEFDLVGPSLRVGTTRLTGPFRPFVTVGAYAGRIKSDRLGVDEWDFAPSAAAGFDLSVLPAVSIRAQYRVVREFSGVDASGVAVSLRLF